MLLIIIKIVFWTSLAALLHTYIFYPALMTLFTIGKKNNDIIFNNNDDLPHLSIIMAAYNEEEVIANKINSILTSNYPIEKIELLIGSDNSTDKTNSIVKLFEEKYENIKLTEFKTRTGKIKIVNQLVQLAQHNILIITDANVIFDNNTIFELIKHFKNKSITLVDSNMINTGMKRDGISVQEKSYIQSEVRIKNAESKLGGIMMGPFGGCYALRKNHFTNVPGNFLVDDFYINMKVLEKGGKCINEKNAKVFEDVSNNQKEEFRRKIRIATGNFQNLFAFKKMLNPFTAIGFCFLSHKVFRWLGPVFMIIAYICSFYLAPTSYIYFSLFVIGTFILIAPIIDLFLASIKINFMPTRFAKHFVVMNVALFIGMMKYCGGVKNSIWEPTKRNQ